MSLRRCVNKKVILLTAVVFLAAVSTAAALSLSGNGTAVGSSGPDQIALGNSNDQAYGQGGADQISAGNGDNTLDGDGNCGSQAPGMYPNGVPSTPGCEDGQGQNGDGNPGQQGPGPGDQIQAGNGDNTVYGGAGMSNHIAVGQGSDTIYGGPMNDQIATGPGGQATIWLGLGANTVSLGRVGKGSWSVVHAYNYGDTAVDQITCNGGNATVYANSQDRVSKSCQKVIGSGGYANPLAARDRIERARDLQLVAKRQQRLRTRHVKLHRLRRGR
jgi:hypothetical protein